MIGVKKVTSIKANNSLKAFKVSIILKWTHKNATEYFGGPIFFEHQHFPLSSTAVSGFSLQVLAALRAFRFNPGYAQQFFSHQRTTSICGIAFIVKANIKLSDLYLHSALS